MGVMTPKELRYLTEVSFGPDLPEEVKQGLLSAADEIEKLREALRPFTLIAPNFRSNESNDSLNLHVFSGAPCQGITVGDLRKAAEVLKE